MYQKPIIQTMKNKKKLIQTNEWKEMKEASMKRRKKNMKSGDPIYPNWLF